MQWLHGVNSDSLPFVDINTLIDRRMDSQDHIHRIVDAVKCLLVEMECGRTMFNKSMESSIVVLHSTIYMLTGELLVKDSSGRQMFAKLNQSGNPDTTN